MALTVAAAPVSGDTRQPTVEVILRSHFQTPVAGRLHSLRDYIIGSVEQFSGLTLERVDITVGSMTTSP